MKKYFMPAIACLVACGFVHAEGRAYIRGNLSAPVYRDFKMEGTRYTPRFRFGGNVAAGMNINKRFSIELEGGMLRLPVTIKAGGTEFATRLKATTAMANVVFYPLAERAGRVQPFVGAGLGAVWSRMRDSKVEVTSTTTIPGPSIFDAEGSPIITTPTIVSTTGTTTMRSLRRSNFAYQFIGGVNFFVSEHVSFLTDIRWVYLGKFKNSYTTSNSSVASPGSQTGKLSAASFNLGIKINA